MRLFIAIDPGKEVKDYLFSLQKKLKKEYKAKIKWTAKKNLHLTLKFLGELKEEDLINVKEKLNKLLYRKFTAKLTNMGFFPDQQKRVIWVGIQPEDKIKKLQIEVDERTMKYTPNMQEFNSHLTLGRIRKIIKEETIKEIEIENKEFEIKSFKLIQSILTKDGPKYKVLEEYFL